MPIRALSLTDKLLVAALAALAGYVDGVGYMELGGFFVSFMSGNSTRMGVGLAGQLGDAAIAASLIAAFVAGVTTGSLLGHAARNRRRASVLAFVGIALIAAVLLDNAAWPLAAGVAMAVAMGAENTMFEERGEVRIGLTYMTGALVKLGHSLALALRGRAPGDWPVYLLQWLGLLGGAAAGAWLHVVFGLKALWVAIALATLLGVTQALRPGPRPQS
jgi:uncharacterized membrane protein YoaK (UPF0700 family)